MTVDKLIGPDVGSKRAMDGNLTSDIESGWPVWLDFRVSCKFSNVVCRALKAKDEVKDEIGEKARMDS